MTDRHCTPLRDKLLPGELVTPAYRARRQAAEKRKDGKSLTEAEWEDRRQSEIQRLRDENEGVCGCCGELVGDVDTCPVCRTLQKCLCTGSRKKGRKKTAASSVKAT